MDTVSYELDDGSVVRFEVNEDDMPSGWANVTGDDGIAGKLRESIQPAMAAASEVLNQVQRTGPHGVKIEFGVKASGDANWFVARASTEGHIKVTLEWDYREAGGS